MGDPRGTRAEAQYFGKSVTEVAVRSWEYAVVVPSSSAATDTDACTFPAQGRPRSSGPSRIRHLSCLKWRLLRRGCVTIACDCRSNATTDRGAHGHVRVASCTKFKPVRTADFDR